MELEHNITSPVSKCQKTSRDIFLPQMTWQGFLQTQHEWSYCQLCSVYVKVHPFGPFRSSNRAFPCSPTLSKQFDGVEPLTQFDYQDLIDNFLILLLHICKSVTRIIMVLDQCYIFYLKCEFYHYMFAGYWMDIVGRSYMIITSGSWRVKYKWKRLISNKSPLSWSSEKNVMDILQSHDCVQW